MPADICRVWKCFGHEIRARSLCTETLDGRVDFQEKTGKLRRTEDVKDWSDRTVARSVHGWQETGSNREHYPALSVKDGRKQASNLYLFKECRTASSG